MVSRRNLKTKIGNEKVYRDLILKIITRWLCFRAARREEENGKNYYFVSQNEMMADIAGNEYLEYGEFTTTIYICIYIHIYIYIYRERERERERASVPMKAL